MRLAFYSTITGLPWGGSEELWTQAALVLARRGHEVFVNMQRWPEVPRRLTELAEAGADVYRRRSARSGRGLTRAVRRCGINWHSQGKWLSRVRPDFALITSSYHIDDVSIAEACQRRRIPYAINLQCASRLQWIDCRDLGLARRAYGLAKACYVLSRENAEILSANLAMSLDHMQIVDNPYNVGRKPRVSWPDGEPAREGHPWRMACVGRLHFLSKGQDLILRVLRQEKWRNRPLVVTFHGQDQGNERQLRDLVRLWELQRHVEFGGFVPRVEEIWARNHALLLPSRYEGLPMVTVEAMLCRRASVVTCYGRNGELVDDNETGFVAQAATVELLDEALERAWQARHHWREMGELAARRIDQRYSRHPVEDFADRIEALAAGASRTRSAA
jgi:glycosyltransferase involved in cell wall biosynthesis